MASPVLSVMTSVSGSMDISIACSDRSLTPELESGKAPPTAAVVALAPAEDTAGVVQRSSIRGPLRFSIVPGAGSDAAHAIAAIGGKGFAAHCDTTYGS